MHDADRARVFAMLRAWLARANPSQALHVEPGTDLIESCVIDSLQVVEFVLFLEETCGRPILDEDLDPDTLRTLDSIYDCYFRRPECRT